VAVVAAVGALAFIAMIGTNALAASQHADSGGRLREAYDQARKATDWTPWSAEPWKQRASVERRLGRIRAARSSYREAIDREPLDYEAWIGLGNVSRGPARRHAFATARRLYPFNEANPAPPSG
jgi:Flp pilus assembly protein TadD